MKKTTHSSTKSVSKFTSQLILGLSLTCLMSPAQAGKASHSDVEEFMKARADQAQYFENLQRALQNGESIDIDSGSCKYISSIFRPPVLNTITLTFDDGPSAALTPRLLDILKKYQIKATFFVLGANAQSNLAILNRARNEGHLIASHSWNHPNFHTLSTAQQEQQISRTDEVIHSYTSSPKLFRYPYGNSTCATNETVKQYGYTGILGWHVDTCDWAFAGKGYVTDAQAKICEVAPANKANYVGHVISEIQKKRGGIILMHDVHAQTVDSVEEVIVRAQKLGYRFANMDDGQMSQFISN